MSTLRNKSIYMIFLVGLLASRVFAQGGAAGAITGTIQDPSGAVVANAELHITNQETGQIERTVKSANC
jgi:hypothetical protein